MLVFSYGAFNVKIMNTVNGTTRGSIQKLRDSQLSNAKFEISLSRCSIKNLEYTSLFIYVQEIDLHLESKVKWRKNFVFFNRVCVWNF